MIRIISKSRPSMKQIQSSNVQGYLTHFLASPLKIFPKKNFLKKLTLKRFLIFSQKRPPLFSGNGTFLKNIFLKKVFLIFRERYTQNPGKFRTRSIFRTQGSFRTLSNICDRTFSKNSCLAHFLAPASKFFPKKIT